jgi:hypothetical protein
MQKAVSTLGKVWWLEFCREFLWPELSRRKFLPNASQGALLAG